MSQLFRSFCLSLLFSASGLAATYYVATTGNDTTGDGSINNPYKTVQKGANMATTPGDTVIVREGTYRETVNISYSGSEGNPITFRAYAGETVIIKGSDVVTGWVNHNGNVWKKTGWTSNSQQVFDEGVPLQQIGMPSQYFTTFEYPNPVGEDLDDMAAGRFWYDSENTTLYVQLSDNSNPNDCVMEASVRRRIFFEYLKSYINLEDIIFEHSNAAAFCDGDAAVQLGSNCIIDSCTIRYTDMTGLSMGYQASNAQALNCILEYNGLSGAGGSASYNYLISGCTITHNNYRDFNANWAASGIKAAAHGYGTVENNEIAYNNASGMWCDYEDTANTTIICNNYIHDNGPKEAGIFFEASRSGLIYNNVLVGNERRGIYISGSYDTKVYNNTIVEQKGVAAIQLLNGIHNCTNVLIKNNIVYNSDSACSYDLYMISQAGTTSDYNCFYRGGSTIKLHSGAALYTTLLSWQQNTAYDDHSLNCNPMFLTENGDDYRTSTDSYVVDHGATLGEIYDDYTGTDRPQGDAYDMGAYETASSGGGGGIATFVSESFAYTAGAVAGCNGGSGWASAWTGDNPGATVASPTLSTDDVDGVGNRLFLQAYSNYKTASRAMDATYGTADGVYWFSVLMREEDGYNANVNAYVQLNGEYNRDPFKIGYVHGGYWFLAPKTAPSSYQYVYTDVPVTEGETVWLVVKITVDSTNGSQVELWVDPDPSSEPTGEADATADLTYTAFGSLSARSYSAYKENDASVDEIRLGSSYWTVIP